MHIRIKPFFVMGIALTFLTGCPPPPESASFKKAGAREIDVHTAMGECGFFMDFHDSRTKAENETVKRYQCMKGRGFRTDFEICDVYKSMPACVEERQGYAVSVKQLESLPFNHDPGFWRNRPEYNRTAIGFVAWRPVNSSQHFLERHANQTLALAAMYECGYPNPLGSGAEVSIGEAARVQVCMQKKGFIPAAADIEGIPMIPVCTRYPVLAVCSSP